MAFEGLENYLEILDLSENNISLLTEGVFHRLELLRILSLQDNRVTGLNPAETFNSFQFTLYKLDLSGAENLPIALQDLRRFGCASAMANCLMCVDYVLQAPKFKNAFFVAIVTTGNTSRTFRGIWN